MASATQTTPISDGENKVLLEIATPDLYRQNGFRLLGMPVTVSNAELAKQQKKLTTLMKLNETNGSLACGVLPLQPSPDADAIQKAGFRLQDPEARLIDELFWFWPDGSSGNGDEGMRLLAAGEREAAAAVWRKQKDIAGKDVVATHNLAVLNHALALDMEQADDGRQASTASVQHRNRLWQQAFENWRAVVDSEAFWNRFTDRIRELDDRRLTTGVARRVRGTLADAIHAINVRLAIQAVNRGNLDEARRHATYIRECGLEPHRALRVIEREADSLVEQVKRTCQPVRAKSEADPDNADKLGDQLVSDTSTLLAGLGALLGDAHPLRASAADIAADAVRNCAVDYGNKTNNWQRCIQLIEVALKLAVAEDLRRRLKEDWGKAEKNRQESQEAAQKVQDYLDDLSAVSGDQKYAVTIASNDLTIPQSCVCCLGTPSGKQTVSRTTQSGNRKRTVSIGFPVCAKCLQHQSEYMWKRVLLAVLAAAASTAAIWLILTSRIHHANPAEFLLLGVALTIGFAFGFSRVILLSVLGGDHACRSTAVEITSAPMHGGATFAFHHPHYARKFAAMNVAQVNRRKVSKPPRGSNILRGKSLFSCLIGAVILAGILQLIIFSNIR
jgi:hypothetical protein